MKKELITILAVAAILAGCTKEAEMKESSTLRIGSVKTERMLTKSVIEGTTLPATEAAKGIGLFLTASDGSAYDGKTSGYGNIKYSDSGSGWTSSSPIMLSATQGTLYGYFPYSASVTDITAVPVSSSLNETDYLYAEAVTGLSKSSATASISMKHALARISVKFVKDVSYTGTGTLTAFSISGDGIATSGTLNAKTGAVSATAAAFSKTGLNLTLTASGTTEECLIVPAVSSDSDQTVSLTCTIDGKEYSTTFDSAADNGLTIKQGIQTNATITVKDKGLSITNVGTSAWGGGTGSTVEIDGGKKVTISQATDVVADDVLANVRVDGQTVLISGLSVTGKYLECTCADGCSIAQSKDAATGKYTFTLSSITKDIEVVLGYKKCNITVSYAADSIATMGTYTINGASTSSVTVIGGETVVLKATPNTGYMFTKWMNAGGNKISGSNPFSFVAESDSTISLLLETKSDDVLPGLFTVNAEGKQVRFSRGNLYCVCTGETEAPIIQSWDFELHQYDTTPTEEEDRHLDHICHFTWCRDASESVKKIYAESNPQATDILFVNQPSFSVNGENRWRVLDEDEWRYLFSYGEGYENEKREGKLSSGKVNGRSAIIILPDDWDWVLISKEDFFASAGRNYSDETTPTWKEMEDAGAVCLIYAGMRYAVTSNSYPEHVSRLFAGCYWTSTSITLGSAGEVYGKIISGASKDEACSLRLIKDCD